MAEPTARFWNWEAVPMPMFEVGPGPEVLTMAVLRLFASARDAAGTRRDEFDAGTVGEVLDAAREKYGPDFGAILDISRVWLNGSDTDWGAVVLESDEVAVLPPVSGGA